MTSERYNRVTSICLGLTIVSAFAYDKVSALRASAIFTAVLAGAVGSFVFLSRVVRNANSEEALAPSLADTLPEELDMRVDSRSSSKNQLLFPFIQERSFQDLTESSYDARELMQKYNRVHEITYSMYSHVYVEEPRYPSVQTIVEVIERLSTPLSPVFDFVLTSEGDFVIRRSSERIHAEPDASPKSSIPVSDDSEPVVN